MVKIKIDLNKCKHVEFWCVPVFTVFVDSDRDAWLKTSDTEAHCITKKSSGYFGPAERVYMNQKTINIDIKEIKA